MKNVKSRLPFVLSAALSICCVGNMNLFAGMEAGDCSCGQNESSATIVAGEKKPFSFRRGDGVFTFQGKSTTESRFAKNAVMLNKCIPDEVAHFRQTVDTGLHYAYGEKAFGHKALEFGSTLRFKTVWGKIGEMVQAESNNEFKILDAAVGKHTHVNSRPLIWVKNAWVKASWNSIFKFDSDKLHTVQFGMFPFELGRGISLGPIYGYAKNFLAIYNRDTDYSPAGILFSGEILEDMLWYDLYYAKLEEKSASFGDVFNSSKEKVIGRRTKPWSGSAKDSDLFAARLKIKPLKNKALGDLELEPYIFYNEASDQTVEMVRDSKSSLGAIGLAAEYKKDKFEFGGEVAFNYGEETLFEIDRNKVIFKSDTYPGDTVERLYQVYSKVKYEDPGQPYHEKNVVVSSAVDQSLRDNRASIDSGTSSDCCVTSQYNGATWVPSNPDGTAIALYRNDSDRYRCGYKNKYRGWMAVLDASYMLEDFDLKVAGAWGYASGDRNPHAEETNKNYDGFVGLYELYAGKRVPSIFVLDARKIKRPLTVDAGETEADSDTSFTDIQYLGGGLTWTPNRWKHRNLSVNTNALFFWKAKKAYKYDKSLGSFSDCEYASRYLGTEFNLITSYEPVKDLVIKKNFGVFFPGSYYKDIKGAPMKGILFNKLEEQDKASLDSTQYTLGDDVAFYAQLAVEYKF